MLPALTLRHQLCDVSKSLLAILKNKIPSFCVLGDLIKFFWRVAMFTNYIESVIHIANYNGLYLGLVTGQSSPD